RQQPAKQGPGDDRHLPLSAAARVHRPRSRARDDQRPHRQVGRSDVGPGARAEGVRAGRGSAGSSAMTDFVQSLRASFALLNERPFGGSIRPLRESAFARFAELGLPTTQDEEWKYTSLAPLARVRFEPAAETRLQGLDHWALGDSGLRLVFCDGAPR